MLRILFLFLILEMSPVLEGYAQEPNGIAQDGVPIPCRDIMDKLAEYANMRRDNDTASAQFMHEISDLMQRWYDEFQALEGKTQVVGDGKFAEIQEYSNKTAEIAKMASDNSVFLSDKLKAIIESLRICQVGDR